VPHRGHPRVPTSHHRTSSRRSGTAWGRKLPGTCHQGGPGRLANLSHRGRSGPRERSLRPEGSPARRIKCDSTVRPLTGSAGVALPPLSPCRAAQMPGQLPSAHCSAHITEGAGRAARRAALWLAVRGATAVDVTAHSSHLSTVRQGAVSGGVSRPILWQQACRTGPEDCTEERSTAAGGFGRRSTLQPGGSQSLACGVK
jgi:hypothetical protein